MLAQLILSSCLAATVCVSVAHSSSSAAAHPKNPKRGLGFAGDIPDDILNANQTASLLSWQYNWASLPPIYLATSNIKYVPMQWGSAGIDTFDDLVYIQGSDAILTFNEPDSVDQANMDPVEAAKLWMQYIQPLKSQLQGIRLGGPAVTASSTGRPWLEAFLQACSNCTIDFLPLHWYGSGTEGFYGYIWDVHSQFPQYPIWITEYAETSSNDTVVADFLNQTVIYLDDLAWIERYAWFGYFRPRPNLHYNLLTEDGSLNALGQLYIGAKTVHTETITTSSTSAYQTVFGTDSLSQLPVTTWPSMAVSGSKGNVLFLPSVLQGMLLGVTIAAGLGGALFTVFQG